MPSPRPVKVLMTCDLANEWSRRVILAYGGVADGRADGEDRSGSTSTSRQKGPNVGQALSERQGAGRAACRVATRPLWATNSPPSPMGVAASSRVVAIPADV